MKRGPAVPAKARNEIAGVITRNGRISSDELDAILKKHRVRGDAQALQRGYRLRAAQRLLANVLMGKASGRFSPGVTRIPGALCMCPSICATTKMY